MKIKGLPLTTIIGKINEKYGTNFTEMDKVLVQMEKNFPNMAAERYEQNDQFFRKLFDDLDMMQQVMENVGSVLYGRINNYARNSTSL